MSDLSPRIHASWPSPAHESLPGLCNSLLRQQQSSWPALSHGYEALREVRTRRIDCGGYFVTIQHNPKRVISTGAKVDPDSIAQRSCFLCVDNLPSEQKGILFREEFLALCNPVPIFDGHWTIAHLKHIPQEIESRIPLLLDLAKAMSPAYTVFYNGPRCGASAPDHLHFQASPTGAIPIEHDSMVHAGYGTRQINGSVTISTLNDIGRPTIVIDGLDAENVGQAFSRLIEVTKRMLHTTDEPMFNVLCWYTNRSWRMVVFLRGKHRPEAYFKPGDEQIMISPAAVDVGGLIVAPLERDFERINAVMVQAMFDEVMLDPKTVDLIVQEL